MPDRRLPTRLVGGIVVVSHSIPCVQYRDHLTGERVSVIGLAVVPETKSVVVVVDTPHGLMIHKPAAFECKSRFPNTGGGYRESPRFERIVEGPPAIEDV